MLSFNLLIVKMFINLNGENIHTHTYIHTYIEKNEIHC